MKIDFKQIVVVDDVEDIAYIADSFPALELSSRIIGNTHKGKYVGIVFEGNCPGDGEIADLLHQVGGVFLTE